MTGIIYHITDKSSWEKAQEKGSYSPSSLEAEGFIHCSTEDQVVPTANRRFWGKKGLVVLVIDTSKIPHKIVFEDTSGRGEKHPHIYGELPVEAITSIAILEQAPGGIFNKMKYTEKT